MSEKLDESLDTHPYITLFMVWVAECLVWVVSLYLFAFGLFWIYRFVEHRFGALGKDLFQLFMISWFVAVVVRAVSYSYKHSSRRRCEK